jgi:hypothetical protein
MIDFRKRGITFFGSESMYGLLRPYVSLPFLCINIGTDILKPANKDALIEDGLFSILRIVLAEAARWKSFIRQFDLSPSLDARDWYRNHRLNDGVSVVVLIDVQNPT